MATIDSQLLLDRAVESERDRVGADVRGLLVAGPPATHDVLRSAIASSPLGLSHFRLLRIGGALGRRIGGDESRRVSCEDHHLPIGPNTEAAISIRGVSESNWEHRVVLGLQPVVRSRLPSGSAVKHGGRGDVSGEQRFAFRATSVHRGDDR